MMMMKVSLLLSLIGISSVISELRDWDATTDRNLERQNELARWKGATTIEYRGGAVNGITYNKAILVGLDSLRRTGHCTMKEENDCKTFDLHYGMGLAVLTFPKLTMHGKTMSAYVQVKNNSVHYQLTTCRNPCRVSIGLLDLEALGSIIFGASRPEFDGMDLNRMFYRVVIPNLQHRFDAFRRHLESEINLKICAGQVSSNQTSFMNFF